MNEEEPPMRTTLVARLGAMVLAGLLLAACGSLGGAGGSAADDYGTDSGSDSGAATNDAGKDSGGAYDAGGGYGEGGSGASGSASGSIKVANSDFGKILTDGDGRALYAFTKDTEGISTCYSSCEENWPPLAAESTPKGTGIDSGLIKTVSREDGTKQAMVGKWPLYYFAGDGGPGETKGQGVNGIWWLVSPTGKLVKS
jgi:predicted lipoprotein with Yx(FWY)xxD motif